METKRVGFFSVAHFFLGERFESYLDPNGFQLELG